MIYCILQSNYIPSYYNKLNYLLDAIFKNIQRTLTLPSHCIWFWCIYYSTKICHLKYSLETLWFCHELVFKVLQNKKRFFDRLLTGFLAY